MLNAPAAAAKAVLAGTIAATAAGLGLGPIGLDAAAVAAIPSIISPFSSTTTVRDHAEDITDLATTSAVVSAVAQRLGSYTVMHGDFRPSNPAHQHPTGHGDSRAVPGDAGGAHRLPARRPAVAPGLRGRGSR